MVEPARPGPGYLPRQVAIDAYGDGGFRFAEMSHRGPLLCLPSGLYAWTTTDPAGLAVDHFARIIAEAEQIELLIVGTGPNLFPLAAPIREALRGVGVKPEVMNTGAAVRTYNVLFTENRAVAGAFFAVI